MTPDGLAQHFLDVSAKTAAAVFDTVKQEADQFADEWRSNAEETAGEHGKHYPKSIDAEMKLGLEVVAEVGPRADRKQGRMGRGFEFGSEKQPAHLDGARALPTATRRLERALDATIGHLL